MARAANGALIETGVARVEIDAVGAGSVDVGLTLPFLATPSAALQVIASDAGTWTVTPVSNTLLTVSVTGSDLRSTVVELAWVALEKRS